MTREHLNIVIAAFDLPSASFQSGNKQWSFFAISTAERAGSRIPDRSCFKVTYFILLQRLTTPEECPSISRKSRIVNGSAAEVMSALREDQTQQRST